MKNGPASIDQCVLMYIFGVEIDSYFLRIESMHVY